MNAVERIRARSVPVNECLVWQGPGSPYGSIWTGRRVDRIHRVVYEHEHGPIGELEVHHTCENKLCVNPDHLIVVDGAEHRRDHHSPLAVARGVACPRCGTDRWKQGYYQGHKNGWNCMACRSRRQRAYNRSHR